MPATTRSAAKQAHIDNPTETKSAVTSSKRKASSHDDRPSKRVPQAKHVQNSKSSSSPPKASTSHKATSSSPDESKDHILINRAPVLELWAASVASFLYSDLSWETSLSAGSAFPTLCAISKGRAIGTVEKSDHAAQDKKRRRHSKTDQLEELEVMGFHLKLQDGQVLVGNKPKKANEAALVKKFGPEEYERAKEAFHEALQWWAGREEDLDAQAFRHYEEFRPNVPKGQKGWGRKGTLSLSDVKRTVLPGWHKYKE